MPTLSEIASCVAGYDPDALPVEAAQAFITRLVPRVRAVERVTVTWPDGEVTEQLNVAARTLFVIERE